MLPGLRSNGTICSAREKQSKVKTISNPPQHVCRFAFEQPGSEPSRFRRFHVRRSQEWMITYDLPRHYVAFFMHDDEHHDITGGMRSRGDSRIDGLRHFNSALVYQTTCDCVLRV